MSSITGLGIRNKAKGSFGSKDSKDGKPKESWRNDFKGVGQVSSWMGKGKSSNDQANDHQSRPLHTLKDPSAFGPPPKNVNYHGGAALPNQTTPDTRGLGAPLSASQLQARREEEEEETQREAEAANPRSPPVPYRSDTSGLSTSHLPPPPARRDNADGRLAPASPAKGKPPGLPPRLPPRQNSTPQVSPTYAAEPEAQRGIPNQGALNRLGAAGVSVPSLGIGSKSKQPLPPPALGSRNDALKLVAGNPQLGELQSRFSRLSSTSASPEAPTQGTTFAQKQAAIKTASSFRNDPSSISLADAKTAAGTANNFKERHGEQVKTGWQSANKLNAKYGIADKVGGYGVPAQSAQPVEQDSYQIDMRDNTGSPSPQIGGMGKKKPPPPPPKKRIDLAGLSAGAPPPIPLSTKPKPTLASRPPPSNPTVSYQSQDLDLDLKSLWFTKTPPTLPPSITGDSRNRKMHASSSGWSSTGTRKTHTYNIIVQDNTNLARTKIHLTWDTSNPAVTIKSEQKHIPPPRKLNPNEIEAYRQSYSDAVATWCESKMGRQVGDGECWTLANEGLKAVAANCISYGTEPCMASQSYIHGAVVYTFIPADSPYPQPRDILESGVARGDVVQIYEGIFKSKDGRRSQFAGDPDHTAVVTSVEADGVLRVVESNVGGSKDVREGAYDMSELVKGEVRIFRAVGESWLGKLDPTW